jgi:UrcA family protein
MSGQTIRQFLRSSAVVAVAAAGLALAGAAQAQPYGDGYYGNPDASAPYANGVTVVAPDRYRDANGDEVITASRVVDISDLDLDTGWGVHVMHDRVRHAAVDACRELDRRADAYPLQTGDDGGCVHRAVRDALANVPVGVDADYTGY